MYTYLSGIYVYTKEKVSFVSMSVYERDMCVVLFSQINIGLFSHTYQVFMYVSERTCSVSPISLVSMSIHERDICIGFFSHMNIRLFSHIYQVYIYTPENVFYISDLSRIDANT